MTASPLLETRDVGRTYPGVRALDAVSVGIGSGEIVGLVGHNGAGKSTLTRILAGAERPDEGEVHLEGERIVFRSPDDAITHGIALVPQQLLIVPNLTIRENLILGAHGGRLAKRAIRLARRARGDGSAPETTGGKASPERFRTVVADLGLEAFLDLKAARLRPPVQRAALIGRALLRDPRIIILDEPTAAFSEPEVERLFSILRPLREKGMGILYITHRIDEVLELADRVTVLRQGRKVHEGPAASLTKARLTELIVGGAAAEPAADRVQARTVAAADALLECEGLSVLPKVRDVGFVLRRGEVLGITGVVGSGRTTLLRALCAAERRDAGTIRVDGHRLKLASPKDAIRAGIAFLPEDRIRNAVIPEMTVMENVTLPRASAFHYSRALPLLNGRRELAAVAEILGRLAVEPVPAARIKIKLLSGGNQQKAMLARWLLTAAKVFIFDEPTEGIDVGTRFAIYELIRGLAAQGAGVIVSSSDIEEIVSISERVLIMRRGEIVQTIEGNDISEAAVSHACIA